MLIEINLAPGAAAVRGGTRRFTGIALPSLPAFTGDLRKLGGGAAGLLLLALVGFGYARMNAREAALEARIQQEVTDSTRFAATIALLQSLQARQDTITQKIEVIRSVDTRRFVWPHLLDEISLAVPAFTWLTQISSTEGADSTGGGPRFTMQGNAGSTQALTRFMKNLEASAFVREVTLITTEQAELEGRTIQRFSLEARYRRPDPSEIVTFPILDIE